MPTIHRTWMLVVLISGLLAGAARAQEEQPPQPLFPDVPITCEPVVAEIEGITITYNVLPELDSPFATGLHAQATSYVRQGTLFAARRDYATSYLYFTFAIDRLTYLYNLFNARAFANAREGNTAEAVADYIRMYTVSNNLADVYDRRGLTSVATRNWELAVEDITEATSLVPYLRVNPAYARAYYEVGAEQAGHARYDEAVDLLSRALALNTNYFEAYHKRGGVFAALGNYPAAIFDFTCAAEEQPDYAPAYHLRGRAFAEVGNYEQAIEDYSLALELDRLNSLAYLDRGIAYRERGEYMRAITDFSWSVLANTNQPDAYNQRGITYTRLGFYTQAVADYDRAIALDPFNPAYYNNRAWAMRRLGNDAQAGLDFIRFALRVDVTLPRATIEVLGLIIGAGGAQG